MGAIYDEDMASHQDALDGQGSTSTTPKDSDKDKGPSFNAGFHKGKVDVTAFPKGVQTGGSFSIEPDVVSGVTSQMGAEGNAFSSGKSQFDQEWGQALNGGDAWETISSFSINAFQAGLAVSTLMDSISQTYETMTSILRLSVQGYTDADSDAASAARRAVSS